MNCICFFWLFLRYHNTSIYCIILKRPNTCISLNLVIREYIVYLSPFARWKYRVIHRLYVVWEIFYLIGIDNCVYIVNFEDEVTVIIKEFIDLLLRMARTSIWRVCAFFQGYYCLRKDTWIITAFYIDGRVNWWTQTIIILYNFFK